MSRFFSQQSKSQSKQANPTFSKSDFPDLSQPKSQSNITLPTMNYKNKLEIVEPKVVPTITPGHISLFYDKITRKLCIENSEIIKPRQRQVREKPPSFEKLVNRWDKWYTNYIELYGEDIYAHIHLYPFYNYNYFDELDDIFYRELDELEELENMENNED
jgi:hypothetical protein